MPTLSSLLEASGNQNNANVAELGKIVCPDDDDDKQIKNKSGESSTFMMAQQIEGTGVQHNPAIAVKVP